MIDAIVPAYNEAGRIGNVLPVLKQCPGINQIIVVDDGSTDDTAAVAQGFNVTVLRHRENRGKGAAVCTGANAASAQYVLLLDADLIGLDALHVRALIEPVLFGNVRSTVGLFAHGRLSTDLAQYAMPTLSGQRVVERALLLGIADRIIDSGYGLEVHITHALKRAGISPRHIALDCVTHALKEEKSGFADGVKWRVKMYKEIVAGYTKR